MDNTKTAFVTFFPINPNNMGSSAVINSRYTNWPFKKKIFQISHVKKIKNQKIETIYINEEKPIKKIIKLPELIYKINKFLRKSKKKIIVIEGASWIFYSFIILFFFKFFSSKKKIIYISHSIESEIRKKYSSKFIYYLTFVLEKIVFHLSDISTSVSKKEQKKIKLYYNANTVLLPNGISIKSFKKSNKINFDYMIYSGSYLYKPNKDAIDYLNKYVMPKLIIKKPNLKLVLTGGGYNNKKFSWIIDKGIVSKKSLYNLIFFSKGLCVPLKFGSGTRIKIIEALCLGSIVISTKKGIEGIDIKSLNPPFIINEKKEIIKKTLKILSHSKELKKRAIKDRNFYLEKYSMKKILKKFLNENQL